MGIQVTWTRAARSLVRQYGVSTAVAEQVAQEVVLCYQSISAVREPDEAKRRTLAAEEAIDDLYAEGIDYGGEDDFVYDLALALLDPDFQTRS